MQFAPAIAKAGLSLGAGWLGKKLTNSATRPSQGMQQNTAALNQLAVGLRDSGAKERTAGGEALDTVQGVYRQAATGNRAALTRSVQPEIRSITDIYGGATKRLDRAGVRGVQRDVAEADIGREMAGRIASLYPGARSAAVAGLADLGTRRTAQGSADTATAGNLYGGLYSNARSERDFKTNLELQAGEQMGKFIFDLLKMRGPSGLSGKGGASLPGLTSVDVSKLG